MTSANLLDNDELIDTAYDIFLELATDNLEAADILLFNTQFEERGAADMIAVLEDWQSHVDFDVAAEKDNFAEVRIGLVNDHDELDDIYARVLISRERDRKFCHILWKK